MRALTSQSQTPTAWGWVDLESTGPEADARASEAARHSREIEDAYRRGLADGQEAGTRTARSELQVAMRATLQVLDEVRANHKAWDARLKEHMVALAAAIALRVVERAHEADPTLVQELAERAIAAFPVEEALRIRLHPKDQAVLAKTDFLEKAGGRSIRWIVDDEVTPGGCIVEGPDKIVDGRIDETLRRIVQAITDA
jgi:flagellar biosynthesis/type III secretory pathway protein FliH